MKYIKKNNKMYCEDDISFVFFGFEFLYVHKKN